jgi:nicotinic acid mononucleotide adenylyltransferase
MKIEQLIELAENRLRHFQAMVKAHEAQGNVSDIIIYQEQADETSRTLEKLRNILDE